MAKITDALGASIKSKVLGSIAAKTVEKTQGNPNTLLKIIGKNFMSLPGFARDLNVARQNMQRLVKLEGGVPAKGADAHFLKEGDRATKLDVQVDKEEYNTKLVPLPFEIEIYSISLGIEKLNDPLKSVNPEYNG